MAGRTRRDDQPWLNEFRNEGRWWCELAQFFFSHTYNPVPCNPPPGPLEVHERGSSTTLLANLSLGYTKVLGAFHREKYTYKLTTRNIDGSFADFRTALRVRLNISDNESLVIKQIDGDYTLDIETGLPLAGPCSPVLLLKRVHEQKRSMRHSAILLNLPLSYISRSTEV